MLRPAQPQEADKHPREGDTEARWHISTCLMALKIVRGWGRWGTALYGDWGMEPVGFKLISITWLQMPSMGPYPYHEVPEPPRA